MKIESIIKRRNGHAVTLDAQTYEFRPPAYQAEVSEPSHIERLLSITEGYFALSAPETDPRDTNGDGVVDNSEERAALVEQYAAKFGKKPHHKLSAEKIRAELEKA